jgi:hypothetical protein
MALRTYNTISALTFLNQPSLQEASIIVDIFIFVCFSGDHDMCVPFTGSEAWTASLGYGVVDSWRPWFADEQVAGYLNIQSFNNFVLGFFLKKKVILEISNLYIF